MSNVSIYEKNWMDLVFEGKNKAYGAYKLRQENTKTTLLALVGGISFFCGAMGLGLFLTSFDDATAITSIDKIIKVDNYEYPPTKKNEEPKKDVIPIKKEEPTKTVKSKDLIDPTVVKPIDATDNITKNTDLGKSTDNPNPDGGKSDGTPTIVTGGNPGTDTDGEDKGPGKVHGTGQLDKLPEYPGGIKKFYDYVGKNIDRPDIDEDSGEITMSVIMSFVIEKDGTMTDIRVLRSTDIKLEKEAIRVLKALKVKWTPGVKDGDNVRTQYMLPIKVKI